MKNRIRSSQHSLFLSLLLVLAFGPLGRAASEAPVPIPEELGKRVVLRYSELVHKSYVELLATVQVLHKKIDEFVKSPSESNLKAARDAWKVSRTAYSQTEPFRYYGGPIDDAKVGVENLVNAWPVDESYIDYVKGNPSAGIINHPQEYPLINAETLLSLHVKNGEKNISTGYHAIEFLLWGQDQSLKSAGTRPVADYRVGSKSKNQARRSLYLKTLAELLENHIAPLVYAWQPGKAGSYAESFQKEPLSESLRRIYTGITSLSIDEMAGERMTVALEKNDQENEQDCFSDYTLHDLVSNENGIRKVYFETGLSDLVRTLDASLAKETERRLDAALKELKAIPGTFDQVIVSKPTSPGRKTALQAISNLETQARTLAKSGAKMGLILNVQ